MSDEDSFLLAIEARPAEAAFLRAEVRWQRRTPGAAGWLRLGRELLMTAHQTPDDWRERVSRPRLAGTTWRDGVQDVELLSGGRLRYRINDPEQSGVDDPGSWRQFGPRVVLTINDFSIHFGTVRPGVIRLRGRKIAAGATPSYWHWTLTPPPGPDCLRDPR